MREIPSSTQCTQLGIAGEITLSTLTFVVQKKQSYWHLDVHLETHDILILAYY